MMRYRDLATWLNDQSVNQDRKPVMFYPGPKLPNDPGRFVMLTMYGGAGDTNDGIFSNPSVQARCVGEQGDYDDAETLAAWVDTQLTRAWPNDLGGARVVRIQRPGAPPSTLLVDDADRTHFVCSYTVEIESDTTPTEVAL